jgi:heme exporter protein B
MSSAQEQLSITFVLRQVIVTELRMSLRSKQELFNGLMFFVMVIVLFPLGIDPGIEYLRVSAGGLIWVAFMLSLMLSVGQMFKQDCEDGTIEQWVLSDHPLFLLVLSKVFALWLVTSVPLVIISPLLAVMLHMAAEQIPVMLLTLLVGTPCLALIVSVGAALTAGVRGGGVLLMLLVLPLATPVLIFATGILRASAEGMQVSGLFAVLAALLVLSVIACPFATAASLKIAVDN